MKRENILKKIEKAKKEKETVENLLKERSATCIKLIGEDAYDEIIEFLRMKLEVF